MQVFEGNNVSSIILVISSTLPSPGCSMWNPWKGGWTAEIPGGFHGMVDGNHGMGDGFHGMVDGIHGIGDEFHGMEDGFHTLGGWIPWFFHMDSILFHMDSIWTFSLYM